MNQRRRAPVLDVCVVGELNVDLILYGLPEALVPDREMLASSLGLTLGSSSAILAHNLAILDAQVGFVCLPGNDALGKIALDRLAEAQVDTSHVVRRATDSLTGLTVILSHATNRHILTYPGTMAEMRLADLDMEYLCSARHFHLSSFFLQHALRPDVPELFRRMKEAGLTTSLDTNDDPANRWGEGLRETLRFVDLLLPNENEACRVSGTSDIRSAIELLAQWVPLVAVKRGAQPAIARRGCEQVEAAPPAVAVVDTVGAGDSFDAGFIREYIRGASLERCLTSANLAGALSTTRQGGTEAFRDRAWREDFMRRHQDPQSAEDTDSTPRAAQAVPPSGRLQK